MLTVSNKLLKVAVKWKVLDAMPCAIELVKISNASPEFYEFEDYARLVEAAAKIGTRELLVVLLGGDAGLRRGEMIGLRWSDVDFRRGQHAHRAGGLETEPARGAANERARMDRRHPQERQGRIVPMTKALRDASARSTGIFEASACSRSKTAHPCRAMSFATGWRRLSDARAFTSWGGCTSSATPSARTSRCAARRRRRSRSSRGTRA